MGRIKLGSSNEGSGRTKDSGGFWKGLPILETNASIEMEELSSSGVERKELDGRDSSKTQEMSVSEGFHGQIYDFDWNEIDYLDPFDRFPSSSKPDNKKGIKASLADVSGGSQAVEISIPEEMKGEEKGSENVAQDQTKLANVPSQGTGALIDSMPESGVVSSPQSSVDNSKALIVVPSPKPVKLDIPAASVVKSPVLETSEAGPLVKTTSTPELQAAVGPNLPNLGQAEGLNETQNANADETEGPQSNKRFEKVKVNSRDINRILDFMKGFGSKRKFIGFLY